MNITVFAGAATGRKPEYMEAARTLGKWIGENGHTLIYEAEKLSELFHSL